MDDPEVRAQMQRLGIVHQPGMAREMLRQMAPLLAAEGIDIDSDVLDVDSTTLQRALDRATEQHNLTLFTPVGAHRAGSLRLLRLVALAVDVGDEARAAALMGSVASDLEGPRPAISHVTGTAVRLLDSWSDEASASRSLAVARLPRWLVRDVRAATTDILALARKGRAFDALGSLSMRHGGLAVLQGGCIAVAASVIARAAQESVSVEALVARILDDGTDGCAWTPDAAGTEAADARASGAPSGAASSDVRAPSAEADRGPGSAFRRPQGRAAASAERVDRAVRREFGAWLRRQPGVEEADIAPSAEVQDALFSLARRGALDPHAPAGVAALIPLLLDRPVSSGMGETLIDSLEEYLCFRIDTAPDAAAADAWDDVLEQLDELQEAQYDEDEDDDLLDLVALQLALTAAARASARIAPELQRAALSRTRVVTAVPALLEWIGPGRPVTSTGGVRRADIEHVAGLLGIRATGVASGAQRDGVILAPEQLTAPPSTREPLRAMAMADVSTLASWWAALLAADVIETTTSRVRPGANAALWAGGQVPAEADLLVGVFVMEAVTWELSLSHGYYQEEAIAEALRRLAGALPGVPVALLPKPGAAHLPFSFGPRALRMLRQLVDGGVLEVDEAGALSVPGALASAVARGGLMAIAYLGTLRDV